MSTNELPTQLRRVLREPLPGPGAQARMARWDRALPDPEGYAHAAVLIALCPTDGGYGFPLILRTEDGYAHGGQVSLPGGRVEKGESLEQAALREAHEEVGLEPARVDVLGMLTPLPVPVSRFLIHPVIGTVDTVPRWMPNPAEVQEVNMAPVMDLLRENAVVETQVTVPGRRMMVPAWRLGGWEVWGATAMVLAEFRDVLERVLR